MTTRAIVYVRQSEDRTGQQAGVDRQLEDCRRLCEREGWQVVKVINDNDVSASSRKVRKGYQELLSDVEGGGTDVVVAWAQDRLLRDIREGEDLIDLVKKTGVRIATVQGGDHDLDTADGRFLVRMMATVAKNEVEKKAARQRRQQRQAAENGQAAGRRAFGYRPEDGRWIEDPAEGAVVRDAFERLLTRSQSLVEITRAMNDAGLPSAAQGKPWSRRSVRYLLMSARYAGIREYRRGQEDALVIKGNWPTLITEEQHEQAVRLLSDPARMTTRSNARKHLGSGLFFCGCDECRGQQTVRVVNRKNGRRTYSCKRYHLARPADWVDGLVIGLVERRLAMPDGLAELLGVEDMPEVVKLRTERDALQAKIDRAIADYGDELIDAATLKTVKARFQARIRVIERQLTTAAKSSQLAALAAAPDPVAMFRGLGLSGRRGTIDALLTVTLLPARSSSPFFDPESVDIRWA